MWAQRGLPSALTPQVWPTLLVAWAIMLLAL
ncbi:hypothetical protein HNQ04_002701 [Deinococcus radiopugnans ATCC 19172]|uniref:Uncharacterized protein n=1 Tax=Deinococcus radiopugnans ATCC 19172 TaxID=585398 RepID=A0ABR6NTQ1_9DEIO|nr:hypothetical protein [Deinococcus radiopugnans ATCC 19172]